MAGGDPRARDPEQFRPGLFATRIGPESLAAYASALGLPKADEALPALARAVATSPGWQRLSPVTLIARREPVPVLGALGSFDPPGRRWLEAQAAALQEACQALHYVAYGAAEEDAAALAAALERRLGSDLSRAQFRAIPRGGLIVLAMLAYRLGIEPARLRGEIPSGAPLVLVDDCAYTGLRCDEFLRECDHPAVVFAHLYSHPDLRRALEGRSERVLACVAGRDLASRAISETDRRSLRRLRERVDATADDRLWVGRTELVGFSWSEPDWTIWAEEGEVSIRGWNLLPPELCLEHRPPAAGRVDVQVQASGRGPIRPAERVLFGRWRGQTLVGDLASGEAVSLSRSAAVMWDALLECGDRAGALARVREQLEAPAETLAADLDGFVGELSSRGLLTGDRVLAG